MNSIEIKPKFEERYRSLLGERYEKFKDCSLSFLRRSIRVNTIKISVKDLKKRLSDWNLEQIPWCKEGFWLEHKAGRRDIGNLVEHMLGYIYIQEAASMIPPLVLNPKLNSIVLDMAASPGSKTTQISQLMKNTGIVIANDYKANRMKPLSINIQRCGITNCIVTLMQGHWFAKSNIKFDSVLVDAPCSGTGTIRKSLKTLRIWNPNMVKRLAGTQKRLIKAGFECLKEGGTLVYSTCSLEPEENEGVVSYLLDEFDNAKIQKIKLDLKSSPAITEFEACKYNEKVKHCLRLWPQDNDTEGFFVAKIKKQN